MLRVGEGEIERRLTDVGEGERKNISTLSPFFQSSPFRLARNASAAARQRRDWMPVYQRQVKLLFGTPLI